MRLAVFGLGYVGVVSGAALARHGHDVIGVDVNAEKVAAVNRGAAPVIEDGLGELVGETVAAGRLRATTNAADAVQASEVSLIAVGTPSGRGGALSLAAVESVAHEIGAALRAGSSPHTVVVRSTVLPGTTETVIAPILARAAARAIGPDLALAYNPEFLREGSALRDFADPPYTIVGADGPDAAETVAAIYRPNAAPLIRTSIRVAEAVKFGANLFHALKVSFANELGTALKAGGVDARKVADILCADRVLNISPAYLRPGYAFGGSCLPKDLQAFLAYARANDVDLPLLQSVLESNQRQIERAFELIAAHGRRRIALFGLAFKAGTDDLRRSPYVALAERLIGKGYEIAIYDPRVEAARLTGANRAYIEREIPHFAALLRPDPAAALAGAEIIVIGHADRDAAAAILAHRPSVPIIDLQGIAAIEAAGPPGYAGIAW